MKVDTYIIDSNAVMGDGCQIGHFSYIAAAVKLGNNVIIGNNVTIHPGTVIEDNVTVGDNCVLGKQPKPGKTSTVKIESDLPPLTIGKGCSIGSLVVLFAGSIIGCETMIGDMASVRENCSIGNSVLIGQKVVLENYVTVGDYSKIQTGSYITSKTVIEERAFVAPMVTTTNDNFMGRTEERFKLIKGPIIKKGARVGGGSILLPGVVVEEEAFIAAGALVTKNTPKATVMKGFPAREIRPVPDRELLNKDK